MKLLTISLLVLSISSFASLGKDKESIKKMAGCYKVTFENAETFAVDPDYTEYYDRFKSGGLEWIFVDEETEQHISMQHLLIVAPKVIVKHWRQEWTHKDDHLYSFEGERFFKSRSIEPRIGFWTQAVYQVDDSPRYECSAPWVRWNNEINKKEYWECESNAPLPRREFSVRDDYNILVRNNRHEMVSFGHIHSHDGKKTLRSAGVDKVLVEEKGKNTYTKVDNALCMDAVEWWKSHERYWRDVRMVWNKVYNEKKDMEFLKSVDDKKLWEVLFALDNEMNETDDYNSDIVQIRVEAEIRKFMR